MEYVRIPKRLFDEALGKLQFIVKQEPIKVEAEDSTSFGYARALGASSGNARLASIALECCAVPDADNAEPGGTCCPDCGGHSFRLDATFSGSVCVTFEDDGNFEVDDSDPTDSEWDGPASCRDCAWTGNLSDLKPANKTDVAQSDSPEVNQ